MASFSIFLNPDTGSWTTGDSPIEVSMGGAITDGDQPFWESDGGTFDDRFAPVAYFTPNNATKVVKITGRLVNRFETIGSAGTIDDYGFTGGRGKRSGALAWDTWEVYNYSAPTGAATSPFFEEEPVSNTNEKAMGFISNSNFPDPTTVAGVGAAFEHAWHLRSDGTAVPRRLGKALSDPIAYKADDRFRLTLKGTQAIYTLNGNVIAIGERITSVLLYAYNSWKTVGGYFNNVSHLVDPLNEASDTVAVSGLFPVQPNYTYDYTVDVGIINSTAIDGTEKRRKKSKARRALSLTFNERPYFEYQLILDFWNAHEKHEKFVYQDLVLGESYIMRFNAPLSVNVLGADSVSIRATLQEV